MKVTGNNLTNICMVVYRVAKTEKNDQLFLEEDILSKINYLQYYLELWSIYGISQTKTLLAIYSFAWDPQGLQVMWK